MNEKIEAMVEEVKEVLLSRLKFSKYYTDNEVGITVNMLQVILLSEVLNRLETIKERLMKELKICRRLCQVTKGIVDIPAQARPELLDRYMAFGTA